MTTGVYYGWTIKIHILFIYPSQVSNQESRHGLGDKLAWSSTCMRHGRVSQLFIFSTLHAHGRGKEVEAWVERLVCRSRGSDPCLETRGATVERTEGDP